MPKSLKTEVWVCKYRIITFKNSADQWRSDTDQLFTLSKSFGSLQVVFGFNQYTSMSDVDSAVSNVELIDGSCNAGEALYQCGSALFTSDTAGRKRVLIVLIGGKSVDDISNAADSLKTTGVKIIAIGIGVTPDKSQLTALTSSPSQALTTPSVDGLTGITPTVTSQVSQGMY